ncbi:MAG TPA: hypothetical protein VH934_04695 [Xanthobacteraceae bacterium]|jgi:hypothetical protein
MPAPVVMPRPPAPVTRRSPPAPALRPPAIILTLRQPAIVLALRDRVIALAPRWSAIGAALRRPARALAAARPYGLFALKLAAGGVIAGVAVLAVMNNRTGKPAAPVFDLASNETVVYRQTSPLHAPVGADEQPSGPVSYYRRAIQTIQFLNPNPRLALASAIPDSPQGLVKVHGFAAFAPTDAVESESIVRRARPPGADPMDEIDDYLWEVYQREPVKRDSTGDFTWKDPASAKRMGMSLEDYVIGGMDPGFREQLYHAGKAMDADGIKWSILSAFRDDYRQRLAAGFKARVGNSLHGGSRRTGGYGHGRAIDITVAEGEPEVVWKWIDAHGAKYGLQRPMPGADPAHIQQAGEGHKGSAVASRGSRTRFAAASHGRHKHKVRVARATR